MEDYNHPPSLEEMSPELMVTLVDNVVEFLAKFGWYILIGGIIAYFLWSKLQSFLDIQYERWQNQKYSELCHKDPDWFESRNDGLRQARIRMQEKLDQKVREHHEVLREKEEMNLAELRSLYEKKGPLPGKAKNTFKPEYTPLSSSPGDRYRPKKRSCCPGGGCG